jgi:glycosyltransferase involved in cell wall biosynthesis
VVVVDDGSHDSTGERAAAAGAVVVRHCVNLGQGAALQTGIAFALGRGARYVCTFDADGQHDPATIAQMRAALEGGGAQVALGSRFTGKSIGMPPVRRAFLRCAVVVTRLMTRLPVSDTHNGLRLFTRAAAERIRIRQLGMAHASEILAEIAAHRLPFVEVPTTIVYTEYSKRKGQSLFNSVKIMLDLMYHAWTG